MEKAKQTPIVDYAKPKKTPTNFVNTKQNQPKAKKSNVNPVRIDQDFLKKQDETWEY